jgi:antitoxin component of MazEF toxin-antitoxin module
LPLRINPIKVKQSVYFRVPNDIADMIGVDKESDVTLTLEETHDEHLLVYRVKKAELPNGLVIAPLQRSLATGGFSK